MNDRSDISFFFLFLSLARLIYIINLFSWICFIHVRVYFLRILFLFFITPRILRRKTYPLRILTIIINRYNHENERLKIIVPLFLKSIRSLPLSSLLISILTPLLIDISPYYYQIIDTNWYWWYTIKNGKLCPPTRNEDRVSTGTPRVLIATGKISRCIHNRSIERIATGLKGNGRPAAPYNLFR